MFAVQTLFILSSARGDYATDDLLAAIKWSCKGSHFTVIVDESGVNEPHGVDQVYQVLPSGLDGATTSGFHRAAGLLWAIEQGIAYEQVVMLSDKCLILKKNLDNFFINQLNDPDVGLIGVRDQKWHPNAWRDLQTVMFEWGLPAEKREVPTASLVDDILYLSGEFIGELYEKRLLVPGDCYKWTSSYGSYLAWVANLMGFHFLSWGFTDRPLPPLYVNQAHGQYLPAPQALADDYLIYAPVDKVMGYSEGDLRELFKQSRGESFRPVQKLRPVLTASDFPRY